MVVRTAIAATFAASIFAAAAVPSHAAPIAPLSTTAVDQATSGNVTPVWWRGGWGWRRGWGWRGAWGPGLGMARWLGAWLGLVPVAPLPLRMVAVSSVPRNQGPTTGGRQRPAGGT